MKQLLRLIPWFALALCPSAGAQANSPGANTAAEPTTLQLAQTFTNPEAARMLPAFARLDRTPDSRAELLAPLAQPYPEGEAGARELATRVEAVRTAFWAKNNASIFAPDFIRQPFAPGGAPPGPSGILLELDTAPAQAVLDLLAAHEQDPARILARLQQPDVRTVFAALVKHRSQSFYGTPMSLEWLAQNIAWANSDAPLLRLYARAHPFAFMDFAEVRSHLADYQRTLDELARHKTALLGQVLATLQPYVPADATFTRKVSLTFCAGADGWASSGVAAISLEYFKDHYGRMLNLMAHETYHAAQSALAARGDGAAANTGAADDPLQAVWRRAMQSLYAEGTATFVAAPQPISDDEAQQRVARGQQLLSELEDAVFNTRDAVRAQQLLNQAVQGAGPMYWLGRAISAAIVAQDGPQALARVLPQGSHGFIQAYRSASARGQQPGLLPQSVLRHFP